MPVVLTETPVPAAAPLLRTVIPYCRRPKDICLDLGAALLARVFSRFPPRGDLALTQMRLMGIDHPEKVRRQLYRTSCRELFRIIGRRFNQLDVSSLDDHKITGPVLYLSYHYGNWEWLGGIFHHMHGDFRPVTRSIHSPHIHRWVQKLRQSVGMKSMVDSAGLRGGRRALEEGAFLAFLADQTPPGVRRPGICLGHPLFVSPLPEWWAKGKSFRLLTGVLIPKSAESYALHIDEFPAEQISRWDKLLDRHMLPYIMEQPQNYFGWWHHRLVPRQPHHQ